MTSEHTIRPALRSDIPAIRSVVKDANLFPLELLLRSGKLVTE